MEDPAKLQKRAYRKQLSGHLFPGHTEEALDLYITAANLFKAKDQRLEAADCYLAGVQLLHGGPDVEDYGIEAGKLYLGLKLYEKALEAYRLGVHEALKSHSRKAAWALKDMAEAYKHVGKTELSRDSLEQASALFLSTKQVLQGSKCLLDVGELLARRAKHGATFWEAAQAYDHAFGIMSAHQMHIAPDLVLKQSFCKALGKHEGDLLGVQHVGAERQFIERMLFAVKANDEELFTEMLYQWDRKHRMSDTSLQLSLKIKHQFEQNELL